MSKEQPVLFAPCSVNQRILMMDEETDVLITGGGKLVPPR